MDLPLHRILGSSTLLFIVLSFGCSFPTSQTVPDVKIASNEVQFAIIGDFGQAGEPLHKVSNLIKSWNPEFIITTGDNNYNFGREATLNDNIGQYFCDYIYNPDAPEYQQCKGKATQEKQNRFFPCIGNHDYYNLGGSMPYLNYFALPGKEDYYDFQWGPVHFLSINSVTAMQSGCCENGQAKWLKEKLQQSTAPFKIVYLHHPPYSVGLHGSTPAMQWPFAEWGASVILAGHDHNYARIHKKDHPEMPYIVNGLGGKNIRFCEFNSLPAEDFDIFCYNQNFGAMKVTATPKQLQLEFYSLDQTEPIDSHNIHYTNN